MGIIDGVVVVGESNGWEVGVIDGLGVGCNDGVVVVGENDG